MATTPYEAARALRPSILRVRDSIDAERRLPPEIVAPMIDAGLFQLFVPADVGGPEVEPLEAYRAFEELARADASVAWVAWNNALPAVASRHLEAPARREVFGDPTTVFANSTRPSGRAVAAEGGYRLSGRWSLVSGCQLSRWMPLTAVVEAGAEHEHRGETRMFFVRTESCEILDTWYTGGLRGTGSHDVVVEEEFVAASRSLSLASEPTLEGPLFRFPFALLMGAGCASICLGIAQSALDTLVELALERQPVDPGPPMRERPAVHRAVAQAEAQIDSARVFLHEAAGRVWDVCQNGWPGDEPKARLWRAVANAALQAKEAVGSVFEIGGTASLYTTSLIERCHRDIWAVNQHVVLSPSLLEQAGRVRLGQAPTNPLF